MSAIIIKFTLFWYCIKSSWCQLGRLRPQEIEWLSHGPKASDQGSWHVDLGLPDCLKTPDGAYSGTSHRGWTFSAGLKPMIFMEEINTKTSLQRLQASKEAEWQQPCTASARLKGSILSWVIKVGNQVHAEWGNCYSPNNWGVGISPLSVENGGLIDMKHIPQPQEFIRGTIHSHNLSCHQDTWDNRKLPLDHCLPLAW